MSTGRPLLLRSKLSDSVDVARPFSDRQAAIHDRIDRISLERTSKVVQKDSESEGFVTSAPCRILLIGVR